MPVITVRRSFLPLRGGLTSDERLGMDWWFGLGDKIPRNRSRPSRTKGAQPTQKAVPLIEDSPPILIGVVARAQGMASILSDALCALFRRLDRGGSSGRSWSRRDAVHDDGP